MLFLQINSSMFAINVVGDFRQKGISSVTWPALTLQRNRTNVNTAQNGNDSICKSPPVKMFLLFAFVKEIVHFHASSTFDNYYFPSFPCVVSKQSKT